MFRRTAPSSKGRSFLHVIKLVSPFVTVVLLQAAIAGFSLEVMSSVRAYVAGEALWSRSQKNAVYFLNLYLHSGDASQFAQYQTSLAVPIGDEFARWALERDPVDVEAARIGFLQGGNHPDDVPGLIWLFRYFKQVSFLKEAISEWAATDPMLLELSVFGEVIRSELKSGPVQDGNRLQLLSSRLSELNTQFTVHAKRFSTILGEGSRDIKMTLTGVNIVTAMTLILLLIWHTRRLVLQRQAFEDALHAEKERLVWQASHDWLTGLSNRARSRPACKASWTTPRRVRWAWSCSISTNSRTSTTAAVISPATACSARSRVSCNRNDGRMTWWPGLAVTNSA
ncbi:hypothetical protein ACVWZ6_003220 [Bradyrhizobium sp. GM6.1]